MKLSVDSINKLSFWLAIISIIIVVFACASPLIFVQHSGLIDFTETGQIGDTIGGIMNPIVALAGVIVTFIAFLMQVSANKMQSEQIQKSFSLNRIEHKIECRNALELLHVDIQIMIKHIDDFCKEIEEFCLETTKQPTADRPLRSFSSNAIHRYKTIDRNLLFDAFNKFVTNPEHVSKFGDVYSLLDYYSDAIDCVHNVVYKRFMQDIMNVKNRLPEDFESLSNAIERLNATSDFLEYNLVHSYRSKAVKRINKNGVLDVVEFIDTLKNENYKPLFLLVQAEYNKAVGDINELVTLNRLLVKELSKASSDFKAKKHYAELKSIKNDIEFALRLHTVESIQSEIY